MKSLWPADIPPSLAEYTYNFDTIADGLITLCRAKVT